MEYTMRVPRWERFKYVIFVSGTGSVEGFLGLLGLMCGFWMTVVDFAPTVASARILYWSPGEMIRNVLLIVGGAVQLGGVGVRWPAARAWIATVLLTVCVWLLVVYIYTAPHSLLIPVLFVAFVAELWVAVRVHIDKDVNGYNRRVGNRVDDA
jgi:uncharacterized membrane protein YtjA (UPF0391 family)